MSGLMNLKARGPEFKFKSKFIVTVSADPVDGVCISIRFAYMTLVHFM